MFILVISGGRKRRNRSCAHALRLLKWLAILVYLAELTESGLKGEGERKFHE